MSRRKSNLLWFSLIFVLYLTSVPQAGAQEARKRARERGLQTGVLRPGEWNSITDVSGVAVGHKTLFEGDLVRTGVTAVLPHNGNLFREKVPAAIYIANGFGKLAGFTQVEELGELETPVVLTNTLSVGTAVKATVAYMLSLKGNEHVRSVNAVVGETNDGGLNDIRGFHVKESHVIEAIRSAAPGPVVEGCVGAGTGTSCLGFKGGIGTSSRKLDESLGGWTVGVLVQTNFGGILSINGAPVGRELGRFAYQSRLGNSSEDGSCMIVVATDAPLLSRNLKRLASRAVLGLARCGGFCSNGSGDYVIAFSTHEDCRIRPSLEITRMVAEVGNDRMSPLFLAAVEATEEAVLNSLFTAETVTGRNGVTVEALPVDRALEICRKYHVLQWDKELPPYGAQGK